MENGPAYNYKLPIIDMQVNLVDLPTATRTALDWADEGQGRYVCVSNVHMCMEVFDSQAFATVVNAADMTMPDGRPLVWALSPLGSGRKYR